MQMMNCSDEYVFPINSVSFVIELFPSLEYSKKFEALIKKKIFAQSQEVVSASFSSI